MQKTYFHNNKLANENDKKKEPTQTSNLDTKGVVDINILLNRVKIEKKNETKRKIIFFSFTTLAVSLFGTFIAIIK
ncbi:hypothetical protein OAS64_02065 [Candidatus Pelagibacter sp.]|nr:hypothetical protein [Candidatus Pelagibacter sp.]